MRDFIDQGSLLHREIPGDNCTDYLKYKPPFFQSLGWKDFVGNQRQDLFGENDVPAVIHVSGDLVADLLHDLEEACDQIRVVVRYNSVAEVYPSIRGGVKMMHEIMDEFLYPVGIPKKREREKGLVGHIEDQAVDVAVGVKEPKATEVGRVKEMGHDEDELRKK